jgi:hypothetical protein
VPSKPSPKTKIRSGRTEEIRSEKGEKKRQKQPKFGRHNTGFSPSFHGAVRPCNLPAIDRRAAPQSLSFLKPHFETEQEQPV